MAQKEKTYVINKKYLQVKLEEDMDHYRLRERNAVADEDYTEALENQLKAEALNKVIVKYLVD